MDRPCFRGARGRALALVGLGLAFAPSAPAQTRAGKHIVFRDLRISGQCGLGVLTLPLMLGTAQDRLMACLAPRHEATVHIALNGASPARIVVSPPAGAAGACVERALAAVPWPRADGACSAAVRVVREE